MKQYVYIKMQAFDTSLLEGCLRGFVSKLKQFNVRLSGPIALPRKNSKFTVNKSPHVDKKSREQFEMRTSKRLIVLYDLTPTIMQTLKEESFPAGVGVDLKVKEVKS